MPDHTHSILSFFSGAGGLDYGFSRERFKVLLACDNFPAAVASYNLNAKRKIAREIDLATVDPADLWKSIEEISPGAPPDGIVGGPPCQGFSRGNVQANPNDPRNRLPFRYAEILGVLNGRYQLKFFVFENVMGLMTPKHANRFELIRRAFRSAEFNLFHKDLDAQDFGVPQLRRRLFLVGLNSELFPNTQFIFPAGHVRKRTVRDAIAGLPEPVYFERGLTQRDIGYHPNHWTMMPRSGKFLHVTSTDGRSFRRLEWDEVSPTVKVRLLKTYSYRVRINEPDMLSLAFIFEPLTSPAVDRSGLSRPSKITTPSPPPTEAELAIELLTEVCAITDVDELLKADTALHDSITDAFGDLLATVHYDKARYLKWVDEEGWKRKKKKA